MAPVPIPLHTSSNTPEKNWRRSKKCDTKKFIIGRECMENYLSACSYHPHACHHLPLLSFPKRGKKCASVASNIQNTKAAAAKRRKHLRFTEAHRARATGVLISSALSNAREQEKCRSKFKSHQVCVWARAPTEWRSINLMRLQRSKMCWQMCLCQCLCTTHLATSHNN